MSFEETWLTSSISSEYDISYSSSNGHVPPDGAVSYIWKKIHQKLPMIREAITRDKRKLDGHGSHSGIIVHELFLSCQYPQEPLWERAIASCLFILLLLIANMSVQ
jgi:hypothetical protein